MTLEGIKGIIYDVPHIVTGRGGCKRPLEAVFHFHRIVPERNEFLVFCLSSHETECEIHMVRFATIHAVEVENGPKDIYASAGETNAFQLYQYEIIC